MHRLFSITKRTRCEMCASPALNIQFTIYTLSENELKYSFRVNQYLFWRSFAKRNVIYVCETYLKTPLPIPQDFSQVLRESSFAHEDSFSWADDSHVSFFAGFTRITRSVVLRSGPLHFNFSLMNKPISRHARDKKIHPARAKCQYIHKTVILMSM